MNKSAIFFATLAMSCSAAAFAQGASGNSDMQSNGSMTQPETTGTLSSPPSSADSSINNGTNNGTTSTNATTKKSWNKPHSTTGTNTSGTVAQPAGNDTGMSGSGPGVSSNANGMGTTSH